MRRKVAKQTPTGDSRARGGSGASGEIGPERNAQLALTESVCPTKIAAVRGGQWISADELRCTLMERLTSGSDAASESGAQRNAHAVVIDLEGIDYLEASALQILLAGARAVQREGGTLRLGNVSGELQRWFAIAGADAFFGDCP